MKKCCVVLVICLFMSVTTMVSAQDVFESEKGPVITYETGIVQREYADYSQNAQTFLSALDSCYGIIGLYKAVLDPYANGEKEFDSEEWNTIAGEIKYISGISCSYVMSNEVPEELAEHEFEIFYAAYHLMLANDLLLTSIESGEEVLSSVSDYYFNIASDNLAWWDESEE